MKQTYTVTGMTCGSCELAVKNALQSLPHVKSAEVSKKDLQKVMPAMISWPKSGRPGDMSMLLLNWALAFYFSADGFPW